MGKKTHVRWIGIWHSDTLGFAGDIAILACVQTRGDGSLLRVLGGRTSVCSRWGACGGWCRLGARKSDDAGVQEGCEAHIGGGS